MGDTKTFENIKVTGTLEKIAYTFSQVYQEANKVAMQEVIKAHEKVVDNNVGVAKVELEKALAEGNFRLEEKQLDMFAGMLKSRNENFQTGLDFAKTAYVDFYKDETDTIFPNRRRAHENALRATAQIMSLAREFAQAYDDQDYRRFSEFVDRNSDLVRQRAQEDFMRRARNGEFVDIEVTR